MDEINNKFEKTLSLMIYGSLLVLALGLLTSTTLLAFSHILMAVPALYFLNKAEYKNFPKSAWVLLAMIIVIILSIIVNQDIATKGYKPLLKVKYFIMGFVSLAPLFWFSHQKEREKKFTILLYAFAIATSLATLSGLSGTFFGFNPLIFRKVLPGQRYGGVFGMVLNYAHNLSFFLVIFVGLALYRKEVKDKFRFSFIITVLVINFLGFFYSYTRGAWLGCLASLPFFFFKKNKKYFLIGFIGTILIGALAFSIAGDAMKRKDNDTTRIDQWYAAYYAFKERPLLGYGYLNFESQSIPLKKRYGLTSVEFSSHAHNNFFEMLGSTGILGFLAFVSWLVFWFFEMYRRDDIVAKITIPLIIAFVVGGLTQSTISLGINLFFIMGIYSVSQIKPKLA